MKVNTSIIIQSSPPPDARKHFCVKLANSSDVSEDDNDR